LRESGRAEEEERGKDGQDVAGIGAEHEVLDKKCEKEERPGEPSARFRASKRDAEKESGRREDEKRRRDP
jgi:hypothetical protein